jgi:choline dehydrogenase-like flavoprotein
MTLVKIAPPIPQDVDLQRTYDAIVVGSGAAGGMAAHVLTSKGLHVLLLEAGKKLPIEKELRSMQWPYDHPRRGDAPPGSHSISFNEYTIRKPPYAVNSAYKHVYSYVGTWGGTDYVKNILVDEKNHPYTGTPYAWVRARALGGKTNIWGRLALRLSDYDFKAKSRDGYGEDWPIEYKDIQPYYDRVDRYLGISGHKENLPHLPDSLFQRPVKLNKAEVMLRQKLKPMGRVLTPYRAGVTTDGVKHNKYRSKCFGRGACNRRPGGCDIHAAFDSPTGLIYPAMDTGNLTLRTNSIAREVLIDKNSGRARGVAFVDSETQKSYEVNAKVVVLAASTLESARLMLLSKSDQHPNGIGNTSGHVGHNFCEHVMGPGVTGLVKELVGKPHTIEDGRPGGFYVPRFRNLSDRQPGFIRGYGFEGSSGQSIFPSHTDRPGFGAQYKKDLRDHTGAFISMGAFGEVLPRYESYVDIDPETKDKWGIPVLRFHYEFGDNEHKMAEDMFTSAREMFEAAGIEVIGTDREVLTPGWSIHELGTARMGSDPKTSVLNQFQQSHDVRNLFVVDGSSHVNASCQNPTWTIMALAWRSCDYLTDEFRKGSL